MSDALTILDKQHQLDRKLIELVHGPGKEYSQFRSELIHHVNMEEAVFFQNLLKVKELEPIIRAAWEEHNLCMQLVQELDQDISPESWQAKFETLKKLHLLHLDDEEQNLFPKIKKLASPAFLEEVGQQMLFQKRTTQADEILYPETPGSHKLE